jgi:hypothetical protein
MMKKISLLVLVLVIAALQSCTIFSLHPLYEEEDLLYESALIGLWQDKEDGDEFVAFERIEDNRYLFRYMEAPKGGNIPEITDTVSFEAGLLKVGDHYFLDLYPYFTGDRDESYFLFRNFVPTHSFLKIEWKTDEIILYMFEPDRMKKLFEQNRIRIKHEIINDDYIVITASTQDLQQFIKKYADDSAAFDEPGFFRKVKEW